MQIIQGIRDKGAALAIGIIALCLIGFILMDAKTGSSSSMFGGNSNTIGKINGKSIDRTEFNNRVDLESKKQAGNTGRQPSSAELLNIREQVWNQVVAENVFYDEAEKLGITLTSKELSSILMSNDPSNPFTQERNLMDSTGKLDQIKVAEAIKNIKKYKGEDRQMIDYRVLEPLKLSTAASKYSGMIGASAYYPAWMQQRDNTDAITFANISYVSVAYNEISDSAVKVTDEDINNYVAKKKDLFKQEAGRTISYINFSTLPSRDDSAKTKLATEQLVAAFAADSNAKAFVAKNASAVDFKDEFLPVAKIPSTAKDTIIKQPIGTVYGPYLDKGSSFVIDKDARDKRTTRQRTCKTYINTSTGSANRPDDQGLVILQQKN